MLLAERSTEVHDGLHAKTGLSQSFIAGRSQFVEAAELAQELIAPNLTNSDDLIQAGAD